MIESLGVYQVFAIEEADSSDILKLELFPSSLAGIVFV
jgi:hypothetical protein